VEWDSLEDDVKHLKGVTTLEVLILDEIHLSGENLGHLKKMTRLDLVFLEGNQVTDATIKRVQQALPKCEIRRSDS
jgi:hypothetical protein